MLSLAKARLSLAAGQEEVPSVPFLSLRDLGFWFFPGFYWQILLGKGLLSWGGMSHRAPQIYFGAASGLGGEAGKWPKARPFSALLGASAALLCTWRFFGVMVSVSAFVLLPFRSPARGEPLHRPKSHPPDSVMLYCNFRSLAFLGLLGFLIRQLKIKLLATLLSAAKQKHPGDVRCRRLASLTPCTRALAFGHKG